VQLAFLNASTPSQIETAFTTLVERRIGALTIGAGAFLNTTQHEQIIRLAVEDGVGHGRICDHVVPVLHVELAGDDG
jgi:hypothetical protein